MADSELEVRLNKQLVLLKAQINSISATVQRLHKQTTHPSVLARIVEYQNSNLGDLTGTTHQVIVTNGAKSIFKKDGVSLSLPQDIDLTSAPVFAGITPNVDKQDLGTALKRWDLYCWDAFIYDVLDWSANPSKPKIYSQATEPNIPNDTFAFWNDTSTGFNYLLLDIGGTQHRITDVAAVIHAATAKSPPIDNDEFGIADSASTYTIKKVLWSSIKSTLKTYFDAIYSVIGNYITALTGDVTASGPGSATATISAGAVSLSKMANLAANSIIGNNTGVPATPLALSTSATKTLLSLNNVTNDAQIPLAQKAAASGVASLDGSSKVVQDPASATAGNWTGALVPSVSGSITMNLTGGKYVKIGDMVIVTGTFSVTSVSSPVGNLTLTGLPFTVGNDDRKNSAMSIFATGLDAAATTSIVGYLAKNGTTAYIYTYAAGDVSAAAALVKAGSQFIIGATYFV